MCAHTQVKVRVRTTHQPGENPGLMCAGSGLWTAVNRSGRRAGSRTRPRTLSHAAGPKWWISRGSNQGRVTRSRGTCAGARRSERALTRWRRGCIVGPAVHVQAEPEKERRWVRKLPRTTCAAPSADCSPRVVPQTATAKSRRQEPSCPQSSTVGAGTPHSATFGRISTSPRVRTRGDSRFVTFAASRRRRLRCANACQNRRS